MDGVVEWLIWKRRLAKEKRTLEGVASAAYVHLLRGFQMVADLLE